MSVTADYRLVFSIPYDDLPYLCNALDLVLDRVLQICEDGSISHVYSQDRHDDAAHMAWYTYDVKHCAETSLRIFIRSMLQHEILGVPIRLHAVYLMTGDNSLKQIWEGPKESDIYKAQRDCVSDALRDLFPPVPGLDNPFEAIIFEKENHEH